MVSGGARNRSGPPPDPNALRRSREGEWLTLPSGGRVGDAPRWPLTSISDRERYVWREMWGKPQAVAWEKFGLHYEVGLLVRRMTEAEEPGSPSALSTLVRQMMDSLGLTVPGMRANRWKVSEDEVADLRDGRRAPASSVRSRLRVVEPPAVA